MKKYNYKYVNVRVDNDVFEEFNKIVNEFGFNRSKLMRQLIQKFIIDYKNEKNFIQKIKI